jgi:hypothetical protein
MSVGQLDSWTVGQLEDIVETLHARSVQCCKLYQDCQIFLNNPPSLPLKQDPGFADDVMI